MIVVGPHEPWGIILTFLHEDDPRPAREQFNAHYISGWHPFDGFTMLDPKNFVIQYEGKDGKDPPLSPFGAAVFRMERLLIYPSAWVVIVQPDDSWEVARMD